MGRDIFGTRTPTPRFLDDHRETPMPLVSPDFIRGLPRNAQERDHLPLRTPSKVTVDGFLVGRHDPAAHDRPSLMDNPWDDDPRTNEDRALERFVYDMRMIAGRTPCGGAVIPSSIFSTGEEIVEWFGSVVDEITAAFRRRDEELDRLRRIEHDVAAMRRVLGIAPSAGGQ